VGKNVTGMTMDTDKYLFAERGVEGISSPAFTVATEHQPADDPIVSVYIEGQRRRGFVTNHTGKRWGAASTTTHHGEGGGAPPSNHRAR